MKPAPTQFELFLSYSRKDLLPDYFKSDNCLWEWEEFHRHKASRLIGHESVTPVYFVEAPGSDEQAVAAFQVFVLRGHYREDEMATFIPRWKEWHAAVRCFNNDDFHPWFQAGSEALAEEDVKHRLEALAGSLTARTRPHPPAADAPGNLSNYNPHFVGRSHQLVALHKALIRDGAVGVITAVNGLGGQGKTEFAVTYAHSHADDYPGGLWVLAAKNRTELLPRHPRQRLRRPPARQDPAQPVAAGGLAAPRGQNLHAQLKLMFSKPD